MEKIKTEQKFREVIADRIPTVAVFKTTWCKDCHYIEPFMPEIEDRYRGALTFYQIDRDEMPELCLELGILGIPSFVVFKEGREVVRFVSKLRKTKEEVEQFLDRAVAVAGALPTNGSRQ